MQPYLGLLKTPNVEEIAALPLEKRHVWRIASALKWGFADLDSVYVPVDRERFHRPGQGSRTPAISPDAALHVREGSRWA